MSLRRRLALATAAALLATTFAPGAAAAQSPADPDTPGTGEPTDILTTDFSDGDLDQWWDNGGAERISFPEIEGETVLAVDRSADHHGIQSPHGILEDLAQPGDTVVYTANVRLGAEVETPVDARWVAHDDGAGHNYQWGDATAVDAQGWTEVSSSFEITEATDLTAFRAFTGLPDTPGLESYEYYLRSATMVLIPADQEDNSGDDESGSEQENGTGDGNDSGEENSTGEENGADNGGSDSAEGDWSVVASYDFEDGTDPWRGRGDASLELSDDAYQGDAALQTTGRSANWHGPELPFDEFENHGTYRFTAWVKLPEGTTGTDTLGTSMNVPGSDTNEFPWVSGRESVGADEWVELTGEFETESSAAAASFYVEATEPDTEFLIDAVTVEHLPGQDQDDEDEDGSEIVDSPETLSHDFEDGELGPWAPRYVNDDQHTVTVTDTTAYDGDYSAAVTDRTHQGQGIGADASAALAGGTQYEITAALRFAEGEEPDDIWLSAAATTGSSTSFSTLGQLTGIGNADWTVVTQQFTAPSADELTLYFETSWDNDNPGITSTFFIDEIEVTRVQDDFDSSLTPLKDTVGFPLGVAIDERETSGTAANVVNHHFDRVTAENHMKPESWFAGEGADTFRMHSQAEAILDYAAANDLGVYGHVLVWHSQTPSWFFRDSAGSLLSRDAMDARMEEHIAAVAGAIAEEYGLFGSENNPVVAYDVVNEVIADGGEHADGMRRSEWYQIYGDETYVDQAFHYADHYFNTVHAVDGQRPVSLYINDYNTELSGKRDRMIAFTERLLERGVPVDGFAHQFHLNLSMPISALEQAFQQVEDTFPGMRQAVTELDITVGDQVNEGALIDQGYHYRDAFRLFRDWADHLDSVAIWGLTDGRSWRSAQAPLVFNDNFSPKHAYFGIIDSELPPRENRAVVFQHDDDAAESAQYWENLPLHTTEDETAAFQIRWHEDGLVFFVDSSADSVTIEYEGETYTLEPQGVTDVPLEGISRGDSLVIDLLADDDAWLNATLNLVEGLSYLEVPEAQEAPAVDASRAEIWDSGSSLVTETPIETGGRDGARAEVHALWHGSTLHLLAEVTDPDVDVSASDPWVQDSVEFFLDLGNERNGPYRTASRQGHHLLSEQFDFQFRISAENEVSVGTGDEQFQLEQLESATARTDDGYIVQAAIDMREYGGVGTVHGLDVQVNDSHEGARLVTSWADPTGNGYQSTERWGVIRLVGEADEDSSPSPTPSPSPTDASTDEPTSDPIDEPTSPSPTDSPDPTDPAAGIWPPDAVELTDDNRGDVEVLTDPAVAGEDIEVSIGAEHRAQSLRSWLFSEPQDLGESAADAEGITTLSLPQDSAGEHRLAVYTTDGDLIGWTEITIVAPADAADSAAGDADRGLASTGAAIGAVLLGAMVLLIIGGVALRFSRRRSAEIS